MTVVGVPKELKDQEQRVALTPAGASELTAAGHRVLFEKGAGMGSRIPDEDLLAAGAQVVDDAETVWADSDLLLKVKEPIAEELPLLRPDLTLFTYLHLAANRTVTDALLKAGCTAIAYETVTARDGTLPLLTPMSEIAGRLATIVGADLLRSTRGGRGVLMGGSSGVDAARTVVIGAGVAGWNSIRMAQGMESDVVVLDTNIARLRDIDRIYRGAVRTLVSNRLTLEEELVQADIVIGAVLVPGARAPKVIDKDAVVQMKEGSVLVDISIDQGGCSDTSRPTTHTDPTYFEFDVLHYCVGNMPGTVPRTSTYALTNATLPYVLALANDEMGAMRKDRELREGVNCVAGVVTNEGVAEAHGLPHIDVHDYLS